MNNGGARRETISRRQEERDDECGPAFWKGLYFRVLVPILSSKGAAGVTGNAVATIVVARWEGALDLPRLHAALKARAGSSPRGRAMRCGSKGGATCP